MGDLIYRANTKNIFTKPIVFTASSIVVGVFFWLPILSAYLYKKLRTTKRRAYAFAALILFTALPMQSIKIFRKSFVWDQFIRYFSVKAFGSRYSAKDSVYAIAPHGIIPFSLGLTAFHDLSTVFNQARIAVAKATRVYNENLSIFLIVIPTFSNLNSSCRSLVIY